MVNPLGKFLSIFLKIILQYVFLAHSYFVCPKLTRCVDFEFRLHRREKGKLYSCAIRPAAIYGPGEERHLPRIIKLAKLGLLPFKIGDTKVKSDWVYVDNIVLAMLQASMGLLDDIPGRVGRPVAAGQAYFISDGKLVHKLIFIFFN